MLSLAAALDQIASRGPRFAVVGTIRRDELRLEFADTSARAEEIADRMRGDRLHQVRVHVPVGDPDLGAIGRALAAARMAERDAAALARAAALRADEAGTPEAAIARELGVNRMTVRSWLGKR